MNFSVIIGVITPLAVSVPSKNFGTLSPRVFCLLEELYANRNSD